MDSGAIDSVCGRDIGKKFGIKETSMSKSGGYYLSASKHKIFNEGETTIKGVNNLGIPAGITMQVADVKSTLGSVRRVCEAGNKVVFDEDGSYIQNKSTGVMTPLIKETGVYYLHIWVPKEGFGRQSESL